MKIKDTRSLFGAVALVVTGITLAVMLDQYLHATEGAFSRSRLWWEVVLNTQIMSAAMMWFCYSDRIENSVGPVKRLQIVRLCFAMVTVLVPSIFGLIGIWFNWFHYVPSPVAISVFCAAVFMYWALGLWVHTLVQKKRRTRGSPAPRGYYAMAYTPIMVLIIIAIVDAPLGGHIWLFAIPVLIYIQGAMPFVVKAFGLRS